MITLSYEYFYCPECSGNGFKSFESTDDFKNWLSRQYLNWCDMLYAYHQWKKYGEVECQNCCGTGKIEVMQ